ncbi:MAG: thiamine pyrophosphate-binding protein [Anaerolineales bacterium]|nr:thiamine pyrophosphate-binding protein [Anaerolineales bacterium]
MSLSGGQLAVKMLVRYGVRTLFGVPGDTGLAFYAALQEAQERGEITHILARDERSAAYMADAYARVCFRPGVCEGPSGAGATYLAAGLAEAHTSSIPVIAINSDTPIGMEDRNVLTALDLPALFAPITKWSKLVKQAAQIPGVMRQAFRSAVTGRPGAVQITIPSDVLAEKATCGSLHVEDACARYPAYPNRPDPTAIERAAEQLANAAQPVIIAGGGTVTSGAWAELTQLAELLGAPVGTSIGGKGAIAEDHSLSMGIVGSNGRRPYANELLKQADLILYVGCKTDSVTTAGWNCPPTDTCQTILHLDVDPLEIGRNYPTAVGLVGDARLGLMDLIRAVQKQTARTRDNPLDSYRTEIEAFWTDFEQKSLVDSSPIMPQRIIRLLQENLPADSIIVADAGTPTPFASAYFCSAAGRRVIIPRGLGGLGYAMAAVVGAKLAQPDATVVGLAGDGSFGMSSGELETIARLQLPITIIHFNNACFGWIKVSQRLLFDQKDFGVDFSADTDYASIARGFGLQAERVEVPDKLESVLRKALKSPYPTFIDVLTVCETEEVPPVEKFHRASRKGE